MEITDDASAGMLPTDSLSVARYSDFLEHFPNDQGALIVFENLLCKEEGWELIKLVVDDFQKHPLVDRTISLASPASRYVEAGADLIELDRFRDTEFISTRRRCEAAMNYEPFRNVLVSENAEATALFLLTEGEVDAVTFTRQLREVIRPYLHEAKVLGGEIILTGEPVMSAEVSTVIAKDSVFVAVTLALMLLLLYLVTRSLITVAAAFALNLFVLSVTYGLMGWLGFTLTPATSLVVFLLVPLSSAFVVHTHGYFERIESHSVVSRVSRPAFLLAGLTTAIGFASTGLTPARDIQLLALMGMIGVSAATIGVFLIAIPIVGKEPEHSFRVRIGIPTKVLGNPVYGYVLFFTILGSTVVGLSQLNINYGPTNYLPASNSARADFDRAGRFFGRMNLPLMIEVDSAERLDPWIKLKPLVSKLKERYPHGFQAAWFYDHMSEVTKAFTLDASGNSEDFPTNDAMFAQLLLLFEPDDLMLYMDEGRQRLLILFQIPFEGSHEYFEMKKIVEDYLQASQIEGYFVGRVSSFFETGHRMGPDNLRGLLVGGMIVFFVLWALFRSFPLALAGIIVNALPVLAGLAALGLLRIDIDMGSSIVAAIAFGIVLDDSTHLLVRVKQLVATGYDPYTAVTRSISDLMTPILTTTGVICLGFAVLLAAEMQPFNDFAVVILITLLTALATDLLVLPILVRKFMKDPIA